MSPKFFVPVLFLLAALPARAQDKLYPVTGNKGFPVILTTDRFAFVVEKAFQHKLTLGYPSDDRFRPDTGAPLILLWLRVQNLSQRPMEFSTAKFTSTDEEARTYSALTVEEVTNRISAGGSGSIGTKTLRSLSLGRVGGKPSEEQLTADIQRYSLRSSEVPAGGVKEGLIYFEKPPRKNYTVSITLGDLWSQPLAFSTAKQK
ncbi:MAG: hypothetical protein DMG15_03680 [Acidobacteria bacterium]|nr:MAG: hypothetical protein DMG16_15090 [Acidobacteriota bacterium]PYS15990.1 MAG: hypothetical protein DMG15_03680 [Acidobacteriota bacterium]